MTASMMVENGTAHPPNRIDKKSSGRHFFAPGPHDLFGHDAFCGSIALVCRPSHCPDVPDDIHPTSSSCTPT